MLRKFDWLRLNISNKPNHPTVKLLLEAQRRENDQSTEHLKRIHKFGLLALPDPVGHVVAGEDGLEVLQTDRVVVTYLFEGLEELLELLGVH